MNRDIQALLIANGALVLLAGFAAGMPYGSEVVASIAPGAAAADSPSPCGPGTWRISKGC